MWVGLGNPDTGAGVVRDWGRGGRGRGSGVKDEGNTRDEQCVNSNGMDSAGAGGGGGEDGEVAKGGRGGGGAGEGGIGDEEGELVQDSFDDDCATRCVCVYAYVRKRGGMRQTDRQTECAGRRERGCERESACL